MTNERKNKRKGNHAKSRQKARKGEARLSWSRRESSVGRTRRDDGTPAHELEAQRVGKGRLLGTRRTGISQWEINQLIYAGIEKKNCAGSSTVSRTRFQITETPWMWNSLTLSFCQKTRPRLAQTIDRGGALSEAHLAGDHDLTRPRMAGGLREGARDAQFASRGW